MANVRKPSDVLNKRMPENPRYKHVKPVVDTGASLRKYLEVIEDLRRNFKYRKDEVFKRIKLQTLVSLMVEVAKLKHKKKQLNEMKNNDQENKDGGNNNVDNKKCSDKGSSQATLHNLITGVGELDTLGNKGPHLIESGDKDSAQPSDEPYLLLDARNPDEFSACHIVTAENYPSSMLSRTMNFETKSLLKFKNHPGKIIVLYDEEELKAPKVATTLVQRGYDNIYMLSGGLKYASEKFSRGLIRGTLPPSCRTRAQSRRDATSAISSSTTASFKNLVHDTLDVNDIALLEQQLEGLFIDVEASVSGKSTAASTVTRSTTASRASKTTTSTRMTSRSKPWK